MSSEMNNPTNDAALRSFVPVSPESHFPIQNLPYGVFRCAHNERSRIGVAIGEFVLDVTALEDRGFFDQTVLGGRRVFDGSSLNAFLASGHTAWSEVRAVISRLLRDDEPRLRDDAGLRDSVLIPMGRVEMRMPVAIGDYTDFYSSREHATNVGTMFRGKDNALMPNYLWVPVGYHGRASSVVLSGTDLHRPVGQSSPDGNAAPPFGPSQAVDFELEMGFFVGPGSELGRPISIEEAREHIFGMVLVNDWSARDIQKWEYVPLGPFLGKNFGTSISPWVVSMEALEPFRCEGPVQEPGPLPYLSIQGNQAIDIGIEVSLRGEGSDGAEVICRSNFRHLYWSMAQQLAHHTVNGCDVRPGDLMASGTISGPTPDSYGSMLELSWGGQKPVTLPGGGERRFLEDGDRVTITGWCQGDGYRVGFGEVTGRILPARR